MKDAELLAQPLPLGELLGGHVAIDRHVVPGGPQVLPEGEDLNADLDRIVQELLHIIAPLAEPEHDARLDEHIAVQLAGVGEHPERSVVPGTGPYGPVEPSYGLHVVVEDLGTRIHDGSHGIEVAPKVRG